MQHVARRVPRETRPPPTTTSWRGDESLTLNGTVGNAAAGSVTLAIEDRTVTTCTLSGSAGSNIVEGRSHELTATASSPVKADTTVEIMRDAAASDAGPDDYNVESIVIEAGETTGTTTLMVVDDDLPDGGAVTNRGEALVLLGSVDGVEIGELTFIIWDAAVPALPVGGALLLEALLLWRGAVWTRGRGDEPGTLGRPRGCGRGTMPDGGPRPASVLSRGGCTLAGLGSSCPLPRSARQRASAHSAADPRWAGRRATTSAGLPVLFPDVVQRERGVAAR